MANTTFKNLPTAWCPGCGNFGILNTLTQTLNEMGLKPNQTMLFGGIGQAAKTNQYVTANGFSGLHGRSIPAAVAAKMANPALTVIVNTGDGDSYGEGGNHLIHNLRRNVDITHFVHDNQIYGLTTGQTSPTSDPCDADNPSGACNHNIPLRPLHLALATGATFVARTFSGDPAHMATIMQAAIKHKGYALVDILQPCVTFNKVNTHQWYQQRVYHLEDHDATNKEKALELSTQWGDKIPLGILYQVELPTFHQRNAVLSTGVNLSQTPPDTDAVTQLLHDLV